MDDRDQRIAELEQQLLDARKAAVSIVIGMADAVAKSPVGRADLALAFEDVAKNDHGETQQIARLVAAALRAKS